VALTETPGHIGLLRDRPRQGIFVGMDDVTKILDAIQSGEPKAAERLLPLVYDELRRLAAQKLAQEKPGQTLQPTALVHEAYLRLLGDDADKRWHGRGHFFAAAAEAMRRILVDHARTKRTAKRGGGRRRLSIDDVEPIAPAPDEDVLALDEALTKLAAVDRPAAELVQLRHFAGLTLPEAAEVLGVSPRTADRLWAYARAWLHRELTRTGEPPTDS
jgi:RNA polymerase sigma factor (TIGR02999 family)